MKCTSFASVTYLFFEVQIFEIVAVKCVPCLKELILSNYMAHIMYSLHIP